MYTCIKTHGSFLLLIVVTIQQIQGARRHAITEETSDDDNDNFDTSRYKFAYGVEDHKTGDFKMHQEERDGDVVKGEYTVADADGTLRTVTYTADKHNGFHAVITKSGNPHQEVIPAPSHATTYQRSIKEPLTAPSSHYYNHNSNQEDSRFNINPQQLPVKKYIQDLPQFAKLYAVKHNKIVENFGSDNAAHYQSVNLDNNNEPTHFSYKLMQAEKEKEKETEKEKEKQYDARKRYSKQLEVYNQPIVFHLQKPQGFRKAEDVPIALPLTSQSNNLNANNPTHIHHINHHHNHANQVNHENNRNQREIPYLNQQINHLANNEEDISESYHVRETIVEEPEWKQHYDSHASNDRQYNNYRNIFESHFGKLRRPANDQGAYSYMNFEGETRNAYELQHGFQGKRLIPKLS